MKPNTDSSDSGEEDGDFMIQNSEYEEEDGDFIPKDNNSPFEKPPTIDHKNLLNTSLDLLNIDDSEDDEDFDAKNANSNSEEEEDFVPETQSLTTIKQSEPEKPTSQDSKNLLSKYLNSMDIHDSEEDEDFDEKNIESDSDDEAEAIPSTKIDAPKEKAQNLTESNVKSNELNKEYGIKPSKNHEVNNSIDTDQKTKEIADSEEVQLEKSKQPSYLDYLLGNSNLDDDDDDDEDFDESKNNEKDQLNSEKAPTSKPDNKDNRPNQIADLLSTIIDLTVPYKTVGEALVNSHEDLKTQQITSTATQLLFLGKLDIYYKDIDILRGEQTILANMK